MTWHILLWFRSDANVDFFHNEGDCKNVSPNRSFSRYVQPYLSVILYKIFCLWAENVKFSSIQNVQELEDLLLSPLKVGRDEPQISCF